MNEAVRARIRAYVDLGRHHEAEQLLGQALAESPDDPALNGLQVRNLIGQGRLPEALTAADHLVQLAPDDEWGHRLRAVALTRMDRHDEALGPAREAVRLAPNLWQTHLQVAIAAAECRGGLLEAQAAADRAAALEPGEPDAHFVRGVVAQARSWDDQAAAAYRQALALDPEHSAALHNLTILQSRGIRRRARGLAQVLSIEPQDDVAMRNVDLLAARFIRRIYWGALAGFIVAMLMALERRDAGLTTPGLPGLLLATVLLAGTATASWWMLRSIPTAIRRYVVPRLTREPFLLATTTLTAVLLGCAVVACLSPVLGSGIGAAAVLRVIGLANVVMVVWGSARARR